MALSTLDECFFAVRARPLEINYHRTNFSKEYGSITVDTLKIRCHDVAINMLNKIVPLVIPFLIDKNDDGNVVYDDDSWPSASEVTCTVEPVLLSKL